MTQGLPEGSDADGESEPGAELFEGQAGIVRHSVANRGFVPLMKRNDTRNGRSGPNFPGGFVASVEPADELGRDGVFSSDLGVGHARKDILQNPLTEIEGKGLGHVGSSEETNSVTTSVRKRNRVPENALSACAPSELVFHWSSDVPPF